MKHVALAALLTLLAATTTAEAERERLWSTPATEASPAASSVADLLPEQVDERARQLDSTLANLRTESERRRRLLVARGRSYVKLARAGLLPASGGMRALSDHAARMERLRRGIAEDLRRQEQIQQEQVRAARALEQLQNLAPAERTALARARNAILAAEEREAAFHKAFETNWKPPATTTIYGATSNQGEANEGAFTARRGRLPFPLAGRAQLRAVTSPSGSGKALALSGSPGSRVRAVHAGHVAFADEYGDLGKTVIIDHGEGHFSVTSRLSSLAVHAGDELGSGTEIGTLGAWRGRTELLFEIRRGEETLDTPKWFGL